MQHLIDIWDVAHMLAFAAKMLHQSANI